MLKLFDVYFYAILGSNVMTQKWTKNVAIYGKNPSRKEIVLEGNRRNYLLKIVVNTVNTK